MDTSLEQRCKDIASCVLDGAVVLLPDINNSLETECSDGKFLRLGLSFVRNLETELIENILEERTKGGFYNNLYDLLFRVPKMSHSKNAVTALIKSGSLDSLGYPREQLLALIEDGSVLSSVYDYDLKRSQLTLDTVEQEAILPAKTFQLPEVQEIPKDVALQMKMEHESLFKVPFELMLDPFREILKEMPICKVGEAASLKYVKHECYLVGVVRCLETIEVKRGQNRGRLSIRFALVDESGFVSCSFVMGKGDFKKSGVVDGELVKVCGIAETYKNTQEIKVIKITVARYDALCPDRIIVGVPQSELTLWKMERFRRGLASNSGLDIVCIDCKLENGESLVVQLPMRVNARSSMLLAIIHDIFSDPKIRFG